MAGMDTSQEVWRPYPQRPQYEISSLGRIRGPLGLRKPKESKDGYQRICLGPRPALTKTMQSIVAETFLGPRPKFYVICHKNGVRNDNRLENLMYSTQRANLMQARRSGTMPCPLLLIENGRRRIDRNCTNKKTRGSAHGMAKLTEEQVVELHRRYAECGNASFVGREMGVQKNTAADIVAGRRWRHLHPDPAVRLRR